MESRLFDRPPGFTTPAFFAEHPWISPALQAGHAERTAMTGTLIRDLVAGRLPVAAPTSWTDLGCGDGSLLAALRDLSIDMRGYDAGRANVVQAQAAGLDVREADILDVTALEVGDLASACDVVEHLADPHGWVAAVPSRLLVLSSPSAETAAWHYEHHAWAWDMPGYRALVEGRGWTVLDHVECAAPSSAHGGVRRPQRFQALVAIRP